MFSSPQPVSWSIYTPFLVPAADMEDGRDMAPFIPRITAALLCTESGIPTSRQALLATGRVSRVVWGWVGVRDLGAARSLGSRAIGLDGNGHIWPSMRTLKEQYRN